MVSWANDESNVFADEVKVMCECCILIMNVGYGKIFLLPGINSDASNEVSCDEEVFYFFDECLLVFVSCFSIEPGDESKKFFFFEEF